MVSFPFGERRAVLSLVLLVIAAAALPAQRRLSLQQLVESSKKNLPVLQQKQALIGASQAVLTDVRHSFLPQVRFAEQLNIGSDNSLAGSYFTFGLIPSTSGGVRADGRYEPAVGNFAVLLGEYELYNFGLNKAKLNYAQANVGLQYADLNREEYLLEAEVARLYFNLLKNQYQLDADRQNIRRYQSIFTIIQALTASGLNAGADSSLAKAELSRTRISFNQTAGRIGDLKQRLAFLTGIEARQWEADSLSNASIQSQPSVPNFPVDSLHNPELEFYLKRNEALRSGQDLIAKSFLPKIMLEGSVSARGSSIQYNDQFKDLTTGLGYQRYNYVFGVGFVYNFLSGLTTRDKLAVGQFQIQAGDLEARQQALSLSSATLRAENAIQTAQTNLSELPIQLQAAQAVFDQKTAQYKAGLITLIDLTNASFVLYRSQTDYIETVSDWYLAQLDKASSTGTLIPFIQSIK